MDNLPPLVEPSKTDALSSMYTSKSYEPSSSDVKQFKEITSSTEKVRSNRTRFFFRRKGDNKEQHYVHTLSPSLSHTHIGSDRVSKTLSYSRTSDTNVFRELKSCVVKRSDGSENRRTDIFVRGFSGYDDFFKSMYVKRRI